MAAGNNGQPVDVNQYGFPIYAAVCDVCGRECLRATYPMMALEAPAEWVDQAVGGSPQRCEDHPLVPEPVPEPVPQSITPAQLRIAARRVLGIPRATLEATVAAIIAAIEDPQTQDDARDKWDLATVIERNHPLIDVVRQAFGKTDAEVDEMFRVGSTL